MSDLLRFTAAERWVHRWTATFMLICSATAIALDSSTVSVLVGRRNLVATIHLYSGFFLPAPMIVGLLSRAFRKDVGRLNRFTSHDWQWLKVRGRKPHSIPVGKFNAGQKLNGAFTVGAVFVMLGTGIVMYYPHIAQISWRTGATFVHDMLALLIGIVVLGHIYKASKDPEARSGMRGGWVNKEWAQLEHARWKAEAIEERF